MKMFFGIVILVVFGATLYWWFSPSAIGWIDHYGILKERTGQPMKLSQENAIKACESHGMRLATIFELARIEGRAINPALAKQEVPAGSKLQQVNAINLDGSHTEFQLLYSSSDDVEPQKSRQWKEFFWSSSYDVEKTAKPFGLSMGGRKVILPDDRNTDFRSLPGLVECLPKSGIPL